MDDLRCLLDRYPEITTVSFVGIGEPFLAADLIPMARLAKERGKWTGVITNGSLLHQQRNRIGPVFDQVSISLHGLDPEELKSISRVGEDVFRRFAEDVHTLLCEECKMNKSLEVRASVVLLKDNLERVRRAAFFCREHGIPDLDVQNYLPYGLVDSASCVFDDELAIVAFVEQLTGEFSDSVRVHPPVLIKRRDREVRWGCMTFFNTLRVDGLGQVSGCSRIMVPAAQNGNFRTDNSIWDNTYFRDMRRRWCRRQDLPECCRYCPEAQ